MDVVKNGGIKADKDEGFANGAEEVTKEWTKKAGWIDKGGW